MNNSFEAETAFVIVHLKKSFVHIKYVQFTIHLVAVYQVLINVTNHLFQCNYEEEKLTETNYPRLGRNKKRTCCAA